MKCAATCYRRFIAIPDVVGAASIVVKCSEISNYFFVLCASNTHKPKSISDGIHCTSAES